MALYVIAIYVALGALTPPAYMMLSPLGAMKERGELGELWFLWRFWGYVALVVGWPGDVFFWNWLVGSLIFRELPRETTFSSRIKRHYRESEGRGFIWAARLNQIWPGHIN